MCTVTIIPRDHGVRLVANRDESPARPAALEPRVIDASGRRAVMPIDPQSGGTWIAATDAGLVMTLLNAYPGPRQTGLPAPPRSRGTILPALLGEATLAEVRDFLRTLRGEDYASFRLVVTDGEDVFDTVCSGGRVEEGRTVALREPMLFTSSGLGDDIVGPPRGRLFQEMFQSGGDWVEAQDSFHRHSWPERRHLSVCMWRPDAQTVSRTVVEVNRFEIQMAYFPGPPDQPGIPKAVRLDRGN